VYIELIDLLFAANPDEQMEGALLRLTNADLIKVCRLQFLTLYEVAEKLAHFCTPFLGHRMHP